MIYGFVESVVIPRYMCLTLAVDAFLFISSWLFF